MSRPKHAVVLFTTPEGWFPTRVHSLPPTIVAAEYLQEHLRFHDAIRVARTFNKKHLRRDRFQGKWAAVIKSLRSNRTYDPKLVAAQRERDRLARLQAEGGAA